jgi:gamma-glutamyltranspeptidase/glutathione hydrolase
MAAGMQGLAHRACPRHPPFPFSPDRQGDTDAVSLPLACHQPGTGHRQPGRLQQHAAPAPDAAPITQSSAAQAASAAYDFDMDVFHPVVGRNGMVASEQELASRIGLQILKSGGNAVDAAVAMGFALAVALPNAGNIGGGGFMIVYDAKSGKNIALDFREVAPSKATRDMYVGADGKVIDGKSLYTHYAVGVPGTVAGMEHALKKWGSLPLSTVIAPAAKLADKGFPVSETLAKILEQEKKNMGQWPATQAIFWRNGEPLSVATAWCRRTWPSRCA